VLQEIAGDGVSKIGFPTQLLDRSDYDGPLIEAPSIAFVRGKYLLFFSSNCWSTRFYDMSFAVADSVYGPYTKSPTPLLVTGDCGLYAPGGAEVTADGRLIAFHAGYPDQRHMYTAQLDYRGGFDLTICSNGCCRSTR
jgi:hypothetical protein